MPECTITSMPGHSGAELETELSLIHVLTFLIELQPTPTVHIFGTVPAMEVVSTGTCSPAAARGLRSVLSLTAHRCLKPPAYFGQRNLPNLFLNYFLLADISAVEGYAKYFM